MIQPPARSIQEISQNTSKRESSGTGSTVYVDGSVMPDAIGQFAQFQPSAAAERDLPARRQTAGGHGICSQCLLRPRLPSPNMRWTLPRPKGESSRTTLAGFVRSWSGYSTGKGLSVRHRIFPSSRALHVNLTFVDIAAEELNPEYMRGYGEVPAAAAVELNGIAAELKSLARQLDQYLTRGSRGKPAGALGAAGAKWRRSLTAQEVGSDHYRARISGIPVYPVDDHRQARRQQF